METKTILKHAAKMGLIAEKITEKTLQIEQLKNLAKDKNFLFYSAEEMEVWKQKFTTKLQNLQSNLELLKTKYTNEISKLN